MFTDECGHVEGDETERNNGARCEDRPGSSVLIVEDERVARRALRALLSANGYQTEAAESAEEALGLLKRHPAPVLALVDLDLPGMSGIDFIRRLEEIDPGVHAVLMTAAGDETLSAALRGRNVPYVRKPLDLHQLLSMLNRNAPLH